MNPENQEGFPTEEQNALPEDLNEAPINYDENGEDPLKRHTKFSWKSFGGDGFIISVIFHAILIIFALFYVVATIQPKEPEPAEFVSGAGGGSNGENANRQQHRMRPKPRDMATQNKITSKSTRSTLTLPEMPKMSSTAMGSMGGMKAGGSSSGLGGGAGGGIGPGIGPGIGNGRAFLSVFGTSFSTTGLLKGNLYDVKRNHDGSKQFADTNANTRGPRKQQLWRAFKILVNTKFKTEELGKQFFKAPVTLSANQIYVSNRNANAATKAFAGEDGKAPFGAPGWLAVYEGQITPPENGEYRFVGMGDDAMLVGINGEPALYAYWPGEGHGRAVEYHKGWEPANHCGRNGKDGGGAKFYKGQWIKMKKGTKYNVVIAFGESAGGIAGAQLGIQQKGKYEDDQNVPLFKLGEIDPDMLQLLGVKGRYKVEGPNFMVRKSKGGR